MIDQDAKAMLGSRSAVTAKSGVRVVVITASLIGQWWLSLTGLTEVIDTIIISLYLPIIGPSACSYFTHSCLS